MTDSRTVTTALVHTPTRSRRCMFRALESLRFSTKQPHRVELIIQGALKPGALLPRPEDYPEIALSIFQEDENLGVPTRLAESTERLSTDFWAKLDDDAAVPRGAWDTLIRLHDAEAAAGVKTGSAFMAPKPGPIRVFRVKENVLRTVGAPHSTKNKPFAKWHVVDCVGSGATVFRREVFEAGCHFVRRYFSGGSDVDIAWQMHVAGFKSILCVRPLSEHFHSECSPQKYDKVRYNSATLAKSAETFFDRWGMEYEHLRRKR